MSQAEEQLQILIVDDSPEDRAVYRRMLTKYNGSYFDLIESPENISSIRPRKSSCCSSG